MTVDTTIKASNRFPGYKHFSFPVAALNKAGSLAAKYGLSLFPIPKAKLLNQIDALPDSPFLGDATSARTGFKLYLEEMTSRPDLELSTYFRLATRTTFPNHLNARKTLVNYLNGHPEIAEIDIGRPLVITGLHRTGSTLLQRLLALDPRSRSTTAVDTWGGCEGDIMPPAASRKELESSERARLFAKSTEEWEKAAPEHRYMFQRNHRFGPLEVEEEVLVLSLHGVLSAQSYLFGQSSSYTKWMLDRSQQESAYLLLKRFFQALHHAWAPESHWVMKAPHHALFPEHLLKMFPGARIIVTHRDPVDTVLSNCRLFGEDMRVNVDSIDFHAMGQVALDQCLLKVERINKLRASMDPVEEKATFYDVHFDDLIKDPIDVVRGIYTHFGLDVGDDFVERMREYLERDRVRRAKEKRNGGAPEWLKLEDPMPLAAFGLDEERVRREFERVEKESGWRGRLE